MAIKISFVLPRCRVSSLLFFSFSSAANKYPPPVDPTSPLLSLGTNMWRSINIARIEARDEILYIRRLKSARADCANSRDARTVNPGENKSDPNLSLPRIYSRCFFRPGRLSVKRNSARLAWRKCCLREIEIERICNWIKQCSIKRHFANSFWPRKCGGMRRRDFYATSWNAGERDASSSWRK